MLTISALGLFVACGSPSQESQSPQAPTPVTATQSVPDASANVNADAPASTPKPDAQTTNATAVPAETAPTVRVLDPGKAPRRALRYAFKVGAPEWLEMDMKTTMDMALGEKPSVHVAMPTVRLLMKIEAKDKTAGADGSVVRIAFEVERVNVLDDVQMPGSMREQLTKQFAGLVGLRVHTTISARGIASDADFELGSNASESLDQVLENVRTAIRNVFATLPEEDVGVGARWVVTTQQPPVAGATGRSTTTHELMELSANAARTNFTAEMAAPPNQPVDGKRLPPGTTATLDSMSGKGQGKFTIVLTHLVGEATIQAASDMAMTIHQQDNDTHITTRTVADVVIRPSKSPGAKASTKKK
jgi:hypothetical protein